MNRRRLLSASFAGALLGIGGCVDGIDSPFGNRVAGDADESDVPGCARTDEWADDVTSGPIDADPESIAGHRDCANANRPEPTGDVCATFETEDEQDGRDAYHSVGISAYPDPPATFDEETLLSFVSEYERAYTQNSAVSRYRERLVSAGFRTYDDVTRSLDAYEEITLVRLVFASSLTIIESHGGFSYVDNFGDAAVYGVDETGIVRADAPASTDDEPPDPVEDGSLLECF